MINKVNCVFGLIKRNTANQTVFLIYINQTRVVFNGFKVPAMIYHSYCRAVFNTIYSLSFFLLCFGSVKYRFLVDSWNLLAHIRQYCVVSTLTLVWSDSDGDKLTRRYEVEKLSTLLSLYEGNPPATSGFPLTHWGRDEINNISQTTFSNVFSSMQMFEFR